MLVACSASTCASSNSDGSTDGRANLTVARALFALDSFIFSLRRINAVGSSHNSPWTQSDHPVVQLVLVHWARFFTPAAYRRWSSAGWGADHSAGKAESSCPDEPGARVGRSTLTTVVSHVQRAA